jgi:hypothetical protein
MRAEKITCGLHLWRLLRTKAVLGGLRSVESTQKRRSEKAGVGGSTPSLATTYPTLKNTCSFALVSFPNHSPVFVRVGGFHRQALPVNFVCALQVFGDERPQQCALDVKLKVDESSMR